MSSMHSSRSWRRNIQSVSRCCMKPRRSWRTWGTGTTLLERPDASIPSACTPWWGTLCVHLCAFVYTWNHPSVVHKFLCCRILWQLRSREQWGRSWVWMIPSVRSRSMYGRLSVNDCMWFILRAVCCTGTDIWNCDRKIPNWFDTNSYEGFT